MTGRIDESNGIEADTLVRQKRPALAHRERVVCENFSLFVNQVEKEKPFFVGGRRKSFPPQTHRDLVFVMAKRQGMQLDGVAEANIHHLGLVEFFEFGQLLFLPPPFGVSLTELLAPSVLVFQSRQRLFQFRTVDDLQQSKIRGR